MACIVVSLIATALPPAPGAQAQSAAHTAASMSLLSGPTGSSPSAYVLEVLIALTSDEPCEPWLVGMAVNDREYPTALLAGPPMVPRGPGTPVLRATWRLRVYVPHDIHPNPAALSAEAGCVESFPSVPSAARWSERMRVGPILVSVPASPPISPLPSPEATTGVTTWLTPGTTRVLERYSEQTRLVVAGFATAAGRTGVLAPAQPVTKPAAALWGLAAGFVALNAAVLHLIAEDHPDANYTTIPTILRLRTPHRRTTDRFNATVAERVRAFLRHEARKAALALAILRGVERSDGARRAGVALWRARQSMIARHRASTLASALRHSHALRRRLVSAWRHARWPDVRRSSAALRRFRASLSTLHRRLRNTGLPARFSTLALTATVAATRVEGSARSLLQVLGSPAFERSQVNLAAKLELWAEGR
jgi:hypothetical protein